MQAVSLFQVLELSKLLEIYYLLYSHYLLFYFSTSWKTFTTGLKGVCFSRSDPPSKCPERVDGKQMSLSTIQQARPHSFREGEGVGVKSVLFMHKKMTGFAVPEYEYKNISQKYRWWRTVIIEPMVWLHLMNCLIPNEFRGCSTSYYYVPLVLKLPCHYTAVKACILKSS